MLGLSALGMEVASPRAYAQSTVPPETRPVPLCRPSPDTSYGLTSDHPVQVGGGPMYGAARQRRYLEALRGPKGEALEYTRTGAVMRGPDDALVDAYDVTYQGLAAPVRLYLDWYHFTEAFAPRGFVCGRPLQLDTPPPDPFLADEQLQALAAEIAAVPGFRAGPVDLGLDPVAGMLVDRFRVLSRRARPGATAGTGVQAPGTVVVAYPQDCDGRRVPPSAIALVNAQDQSAVAAAIYTEKAAVRALVPGREVPEGSVGATFAADALLERLQVRLTFPPALCGGAAERVLAISYGGAQLLDSPMPARPPADESDVEWVAVQAVIDHQGRFQQLRPLGGPPVLVRTAIEAIATWRAEPPRANGAPIAAPVVLRVSFVPPAKAP